MGQSLAIQPQTLFDVTGAPPQTGATQEALLFPTTIAIAGGNLPAKGSGFAGITNLTSGGNNCGVVFSPDAGWDSLLLQFAGVGATNGRTLTVEIGRIPAPGALAEVMASVVLTTASLTVGATTTNPFTGVAASHASVTWRLFDLATITSFSGLGDVLLAKGGTAGRPAILDVNVSDECWYYVLITALDATFTEILAAITPLS